MLPLEYDRAAQDGADHRRIVARRLEPDQDVDQPRLRVDDGVDGARRRLASARRYVSDFGVATECGFGRRAPETIEPLLTLNADVAALIE